MPLKNVRNKSVNKKMIVRGVILVLALTLIVIGLSSGDFKDVMVKAIKICFECIGIG
jgi:hypothetical protein